MSPAEKRPTITAELIRKYDRPGPRYTSYPTAVEFHEGYGPDEAMADLRAAGQEADTPLSLYVHLPFCVERCSFCACNVIITRKDAVAQRYLEALEQELDLVARAIPRRRRVAQLHLGGGTPTYYSPSALSRLMHAISDRFEILPGAEVAVEADPRVTSNGHMIALRSMGFNRLSMGVQDFSERVQAAANRYQSAEQTQRMVGEARELGFESVNIDLIYGLPLQRTEDFDDTLQRTIALRPDRVALYSFAYLPWMRKNQTLINPDQLPSPEVKLELFAMAVERFLSAGYKKIGMDHFALPDDELARAVAARKLWRNFMGYTVRPTSAMIGFGASAIGEAQGAMMQNTKKLSRYYEAVDAGRLPIERGYRMTRDDAIRRDVIQGAMCNFFIDFAEIEERYDIDAAEYFAAEVPAIDELEEAGFVRSENGGLAVTPLGQFFVRNVAMVFDAYLKEKDAAGRPMFSRTV